MRVPSFLGIIHSFDLRLQSPQSAHQLFADIIQLRPIQPSLSLSAQLTMRDRRLQLLVEVLKQGPRSFLLLLLKNVQGCWSILLYVGGFEEEGFVVIGGGVVVER